MINRIVNTLSRFKAWQFIALAVIFSEILTAVLSVILSYLWWKRFNMGLFVFGGINAFIVSLIVGSALILLVKMISRLQFEKEDLTQQILERNRFEEELIVSKERYKTLLETIPHGIQENDPDGVILFSTSSHHKMLGFEDGEFIGKRIWDMQPTEQEKTNLRNYLAYIVSEQPSPTPYITTNLSKHGDIVDLQIDWTYKRDVYGNIIGFISIITDITDRKKIEESLIESEQKFRTLSQEFEALLDAIPDNLTLQSHDLKVLWANKGAAAGLQREVSELEGQYCYTLLHNRPEPCVRCPVQRSFVSGIPETEEVTTPDGRIWELRSVPVLDDQNNVSKVIEVGRDITEHRTLERQLIQSQKMESIGTLAGGIAHDFNNILTAVIGYANIIEMRLKQDDPFGPHINHIISAAEKGAVLIQSLLAFSRKQEMNPQFVEMKEIVLNIEKLLVRLIGEDIDLTTVLTGDDANVYADIGQMEQVLMNLATNARDAMAKGGKMTIRVDTILFDDEFSVMHGSGIPGDYVLLSVSDTGSGLDEETRERSIEPFFTTKETGQGTGLGLAMVFGIIKQHNGFLNIKSERGKGTEFMIYLPRARRKAEHEQLPEVTIPKRGSETILLAEDEQDVRLYIKTVLEQFDYTVIEAVDGEDATDQFFKFKDDIQLLITDVVMPKKNGKELFDDLVETRPDLNCIFLSGYAGDILQKKGFSGDTLHFLKKPLTSHALLNKIREVIDSSQACR